MTPETKTLKTLTATRNIVTREDWGFPVRRRLIKARAVRAQRRHNKALCAA